MLSLNANKQASFFGTIDKFSLSEIVVPFLRHSFGIPDNEVMIYKLKDSKLLNEEQIAQIISIVNNGGKLPWSLLKGCYLHGEIYLELAS